MATRRRSATCAPPPVRPARHVTRAGTAHVCQGMDATTTLPTEPRLWRRIVDNGTLLQRLVLGVGALAGAVAAITVVVSAVAAFLDDPPELAGTDGAVVIEDASAAADQLVRHLIANDGRPVELDVQIEAPVGASDVTLRYACGGASGCSTTRIQAPDSIPAVLDRGGLWFRGCYVVHQVGNGYGAAPLDLALARRGDICAG
jgi:hypothetical protein